MKGFTLVETVIVIALTLMVALALATLYGNFINLSADNNAIMSTASGARSVIAETENLVSPADQVLAEHTFSDSTYASGTTTLVLELPSIDSTGASISGKYDYAVLYLTGSTTMRLLAPDAASSRVAGTKELSTAVNALSFAYDNVDFTKVREITVDVETLLMVQQEAITDEEHEQIYLRNH